MRTLVVFTDFTLKAENTALYSVALASHLQSDIMLCHVLPVADLQYGESADEERLNAAEDMAALMQILKRRVVQFDRGKHWPAIECCIKVGSLSTALEQIAATKDVVMAILSARRTDMLTPLLLGSSTHELIDHAQYPVLLVPYEARFIGFKNLAFATDLNDANLTALDSLCDIARHSDSDIIVTHVSNKGLIDQKNNTSVQNFFDRVNDQIAYPKKRYKIIKETNILRGLKKIPQKLDIDVLALVHQKRSRLQRLFKKSVALAMANYPVKPIIIFPPQTIRESIFF